VEAGASAPDLGDDQAAQASAGAWNHCCRRSATPLPLRGWLNLFHGLEHADQPATEQALHEASACLDKLRGQDEQFFTSVAESHRLARYRDRPLGPLRHTGLRHSHESTPGRSSAPN